MSERKYRLFDRDNEEGGGGEIVGEGWRMVSELRRKEMKCFFNFEKGILVFSNGLLAKMD